MDIHNIIKNNFDNSESFFELPKNVKLAFNEISYYYLKKKEHLNVELEIKENKLDIAEKKEYLKKRMKILENYNLKFYGVADLYLNILSKLNLDFVPFEYQNINENNLFNIFVHFTIKNINYFEYDCLYIIYLFKKYMNLDDFDDFIKFMTIEKNYDKSLFNFIRIGRDYEKTILKNNLTETFYKVVRVEINFIKCHPLIPKYINKYAVYSTKYYDANTTEYFQHNSSSEIICLLNNLYFYKIE
jgi:hypothetical protein